MEEQEQPTEQAEENRDTDNASGSEATEPTTENSGENEARFSQAEVNRIIEERLQRERKKADEERKEAEKARARKELEEQQRFKELADQHQAELEQVKPQLEKYTATVNALLEVQKKDIPEHLSPLLEKLDPVEQLEWLAANRDKLTTPNGDTEPDKTRGVPQTPRRGDARGASEEQKRAARTATAGMYQRKF